MIALQALMPPGMPAPLRNRHDRRLSDIKPATRQRLTGKATASPAPAAFPTVGTDAFPVLSIPKPFNVPAEAVNISIEVDLTYGLLIWAKRCCWLSHRRVCCNVLLFAPLKPVDRSTERRTFLTGITPGSIARAGG